jgi:hypothetical protein
MDFQRYGGYSDSLWEWVTMNDDEWARGLLADPGFGAEPPSKVDFHRAVRRGRQRLRLRRASVTVASTGAAVLVAASLPTAGPGTITATQTLPPSVSPSASPSVAAVKPVPPPAPTRCEREPLRLPAGAKGGLVHAGEPSGRFAVGVVTINDEVVPVLWDNGHPVVLSKPKPGNVLHLWVNSSGTVVMAVSNDYNYDKSSWSYRDGKFTEFTGGYTVAGINTRGDILGAWPDQAGIHPPVVWLGGDPANPRYLTGGDPGDRGVAAVSGIDDDGTVIGASVPWLLWDNTMDPLPDNSPSPVYWPASTGTARDLPMPPGWGPRGSVLGVRSGVAVGDASRPDPDKDRRGNRAVFWDLSQGTVALDDRLTYAADVNVHGWVVGRIPAASPASIPPPAAAFAGSVVLLPMPWRGPDAGGAVSISDDGRVIMGHVRAGDDEPAIPVRWLCS